MEPADEISCLKQPDPLRVAEAKVVADQDCQLIDHLLIVLGFLNEWLHIKQNHKHEESEEERDVDLGESSIWQEDNDGHEGVSTQEEQGVVLDCEGLFGLQACEKITILSDDGLVSLVSGIVEVHTHKHQVNRCNYQCCTEKEAKAC